MTQDHFLGLDADTLLTTTRAVRRRLDFSRPVAPELVEECIRIATQAPTASNRQQWQWMIVGDVETKRAIADEYRISFDRYKKLAQPSFDPSDTRGARRDAVEDSSRYLRDHLQESPYLVIPCAAGRPGTPSTPIQAFFWASIFPAVWSFQLALRARSLGTVLTTLHLFREKEIAEIVGIPYGEVTQAALLPVAYTLGTDFKPASRLPTDQITHWDRW